MELPTPSSFNIEKLRPSRRVPWYYRSELPHSTAHSTLLRMPPFRLWTLDPKTTMENQNRFAEHRQVAILAAGVMLGLVIKTEDGWREAVPFDAFKPAAAE